MQSLFTVNRYVYLECMTLDDLVTNIESYVQVDNTDTIILSTYDRIKLCIAYAICCSVVYTVCRNVQCKQHILSN